MAPDFNSSPGRILGIGGIFFKSPDKASLDNWYRDHLGLDILPHIGALLPWRAHADPAREYTTVWSIFPDSTDYFGSGPSSFMINYIVDDLDALLAKLEAGGVRIDPKRDDHEYGRFAWVYDRDDNKIELWQPPPTP